MIRLVVALFLTSALSASQVAVATDPSTVGRRFLEALRTSDFDRLETLMLPSTFPWFRKNFSVLYEYKIVREAKPCTESVDIAGFRPGLNGLMDFSEQQRHKEWLDLFSKLETAYPCIAKLVSSKGLSRASLAKLEGVVDFSVYEMIVDADRPARAGGGRETQRRVLTVVRVKSAKTDTGWKAGTFDPLQ